MIRTAESLPELADVMDADSVHDAYFDAKQVWFDLRGREADTDGGGATAARVDGATDADTQVDEDADADAHADGVTDADAGSLPGDCVVVDGRPFRVHGITHANTDAEGEFLRDHVARFLDAGAAVLVEQGVRSMYFASFDDVYEMDDYNWAMERCGDVDADAAGDDALVAQFGGFVDDLDALAADVRDAVFALIDSGRPLYGEAFESALGDVASTFLTSHEDASTGRDFESFSKSRAAAADPTKLGALQEYYRRTFLPQPLEREWLREHDPALELLTHARNERMADYAVYHAGTAPAVHLVVGAAHQPGVTYYLEQHRDGRRRAEAFEPVD